MIQPFWAAMWTAATRVGAGLGHGLGEVVAGGALRQVHAPSDLGDGGPVGGRLEHLGLAGGQGRVAEDEGVRRQGGVHHPQARVDAPDRLCQVGRGGVLD